MGSGGGSSGGSGFLPFYRRNALVEVASGKLVAEMLAEVVTEVFGKWEKKKKKNV